MGIWEGEGARVEGAVAGRSFTDVMIMCGTRYLWCRVRIASAREGKSVIFVSERSLRLLIGGLDGRDGEVGGVLCFELVGENQVGVSD